MRQYTDEQLTNAIRISRSWRGVLRELGLAGTSAAAIRSVRAHADRLGLEHSHFSGQRRWTDTELAAAIDSATTWTDVAEALGLVGGSSLTTIRGHAARLGLNTAHLSLPRTPNVSRTELRPNSENLARAGSLLAAAWFELCGCQVSWPLEPCRYDLLVWMGDTAKRVQVKTTTVKQGRSWTVWISSGKNRATYDPDEIDYFFLVDGDLNHYLIPVGAIGGLTAINLSAYTEFLLPRQPAHTASRRTSPINPTTTITPRNTVGDSRRP